MNRLKILLGTIVIASCGLLTLTAAPAAASGTVSGSGTLNSIEAAEGKVNITHEAIPELGWPAMTMDFKLSEKVSVDELEVGTKVVFELRSGPDSTFLIDSIEPAEEPAREHQHGH